MDDFDRSFNRMRRFAIGWFIFCAVAGVSLLGFGLWVVVKVLGHFGVI